MKVKNKSFVGIMMLAIMLFFGLTATADALTIASPGVSITIANRATTSQRFGGDITISGTASDMAVGSTISLTCPSGLKFDTNYVALKIGTNISVTSFSVSLYTGTGYTSGYSSDGRTIKLNVDVVPSTGTGMVKFRSSLSTTDDLAVVPVNASDTTIDSTSLQFTVVTNGDTPSAVTSTVGTINILKLPTITSATFTDSTHFTVQFNCNIDSSTASGHSTALGSGKSYSTAASIYGLYIGTAATAVTDATAAINGSDPTKVDVTIATGELNTDGTSTIQTTTTNQQFVNSKDAATTPTMTSKNADAPHTAVYIIPATSVISSISVSKTTVGCTTGYINRTTGIASDSSSYNPFINGRPVDSNSQILDDAFVATVDATAGTAYKTRLAYYTATTTVPLTSNTDAWQADTTDTAILYDNTGTSGKHSITGAQNTGALAIYFQLKGGLTSSNSNLDTGKAGQIIVQASLDDFATTSGIVSSSPITVDRIVPTVDSSVANAPKATSSTTVQVIFSEAVKKSTVEVSSAFNVESGVGTDRPISSVSLAADGKTATVTSTVMPPSTASEIVVSPVSEVGLGTTPTYIADLVGNRVVEVTKTFTSTGGTISGITVTQPSTTPARVANGNILTVQVNAATGSTVRAHLVYSAVASTTTTDLDTATAGFGTSGGQQLTEETTGVFKSTLTVDGATGSNPIVVVATTDGWSNRTVDDETITLDTTGPSVLTATAIGNRKVLVNFNETLYTASSSVTAANFGISPTTGVTSISTAAAQPSKTAVLLTFTGTASTGITYTVTANSSVKDETTINGVGAANYATFTTPGADTTAPTILSTVVATGDTSVTVSVTDDSGSAAVDISSSIGSSATKITSVTKGGNVVSGTITNNVTNVACIFTPTSAFTAGDYVVNLTVADLAGNTGLRTATFTIYGDVSCSANPATITIVGGTSTITATGGKAPYTAAITSDTTGGATITTGSSPWTLTPGATAGSVTVRITDSQTPARTCDVTVAYAPCVLTVAATKSAANAEKISVSASGGTAPYVYHFMTATPTGAAIDPLSGDYLAPEAGASAETETIMATDANGCSGTTTVKISTDAVEVTTTGSGTASVTISGGTGATFAIDDGVGAVTAGGVYTSTEDGVGVVKVTVGTEWAKVIIKVEGGICTVESPVMVQDVNMDGSVNINDLTPVIDKILE